MINWIPWFDKRAERAYEDERHAAMIELVQAVAALPERTPRLQAALERWQKAVTRR